LDVGFGYVVEVVECGCFVVVGVGVDLREYDYGDYISLICCG